MDCSWPHESTPGSPFFTPKGTVIYRQLQNFIGELYEKYDYKEVITPQIYDIELYKTSGHYDNYKENMYFMESEKRTYGLKPMNCPGHCLLYKHDHHSYRDMPLRIADFGRLHRYERSGALHGITRVRSFCQDDAHIFCTMDQLEQEIQGFMKFLKDVYSALGLHRYKVFLSTRPEKRMGADEIWDRAEAVLESGLKSLGIDYEIKKGDGAFYGPKLDIVLEDAIEREWQLGTLQCDFNLPERFDLTYVDKNNEASRPVMLHRAVIGSFERFLGVYLEHTAGRLPTWLAPVQATVIGIDPSLEEYCQSVILELKKEGIRAELDLRNEKLGYKIRQAQLNKIPYMVVVGHKEAEAKTVTVRLLNGKNLEPMGASELVKHMKQEILSKEFSLADTK